MLMLLYLILFVVVVYVIMWGVDRVGLPDPINWIAKGLLFLIALMFLLQKLGMAIPGL